MKYIYVTFGLGHNHFINGIYIDSDTAVRLRCSSEKEGRLKAFDLFGSNFCTTYTEEYFNEIKDYFKKIVEL